jgi:hypothetical protein
MEILLDADTLLEFFLNRSDEFINEVNYLSKIFGSNSSIQIYISKPGLDKIAVFLKALNGLGISNRQVSGIKKRIKILRLTKAVAQKARLLSDLDYESAVEIQLAIKANISAIVTHKPSDFSSEKLNIITLSDLQQRNHLEANLSKNIKDLPAVLVINSEQISNLDKAFYYLPSYTGIKSLDPKESSHQLDLTCSSEKVSIPSLDNASLRSTHVQSLEQIFLDAFSQPLLDRSTAQANTAKLSGLAGKSSLDALKASIDRDKLSMRSFARSTAYIDVMKSTGIAITDVAHENPFDKVSKIMLQAEKVSSLAIERLSIKPLNLPSFPQLESTKIGGIAATALQAHKQAHKNLLGGKLMKDIFPSGKALSLAVDSLSIKSPAIPSFAQLESTKISSIAATALQAHKNLLGDKLMKDIFPSGKALSLAVDSLSIKSPTVPSFSQLESSMFGGIAATALQAHESPLDTLKERIDRSSQLNLFSKVDCSFSDRSGLLSQIKLIESMQRANILDSYLSRKN